MTRDLTNTERQAGLAAMADAYSSDDRDRDTPGTIPEACDDCGTCLVCLMWASVRREKDAANDREYWAGDVA